MKMNRVVVKIGESALGSTKDLPDTLPKIKSFLQKLQQKHVQIVLVVSAFSGHSRKIRKISSSLDLNLSDVAESLYCHGEFFSCQLLQHYLNAEGFKSKALVFDSVPMRLSNGSMQINTDEIESVLQQQSIPIVPGFIGQDDDKQFSALEFDASDVFSLQLYEKINASRCLFLKQPGPLSVVSLKKIKRAHSLDRISYEQALAFSASTSRIVHEKALIMAKEKNIALELCNYDLQSTRIQKEICSKSIPAILYRREAGQTSYAIHVFFNPKLEPEDVLKKIASLSDLSHLNFDVHPDRIQLNAIAKPMLDDCLKKIYQLFY